MKLGTETGSLVNHVLASTHSAVEVGDGATILHWTDRTACTVICVDPKGKWITVQEDKAIRTDSNGMSECQEYRFEANERGSLKTFSLRKNGQWVERGQKGGSRLSVGRRSAYHDYSF